VRFVSARLRGAYLNTGRFYSGGLIPGKKGIRWVWSPLAATIANRKETMDGLDPGQEQARIERQEQEALETAEQEQREKAEQDAVEDAIASGGVLPDPNSEPGEIDPSLEHVDVPCAGCGTVYGFDILPTTLTFKFECQNCNTKSEWKRV
jgi:hypothetical protein